MGQNIEHIINHDDVSIITVTADPAMHGAAIETQGIWYSSNELAQFISALERAKNYLDTYGE